MFALVRGVRASARHPVLALALYGLSLASAAAPATLATLAFSVIGSDRPWAEGLLGPGWANVAIEILVAATPTIRGATADGRLATALSIAGLGYLAALFAVVAQWLAYAFLAGGILERLRSGGIGFRAGCRLWFRPFVRLGLLGLMVIGPLALAGLAAIGAVPLDLGSTVETVAFAFWLSLVDGWLELARAWMVVHHERRAGSALESAARHLASPANLARALPAWSILGAAGLLLLGLQLSAASISEPAVAILGTQAALVAGAWLKVARLGTALALVDPAGANSPRTHSRHLE